MEIISTSLYGVVLLRPEAIPDERGWFVRVFAHDEHLRANVDHTALVQENQTRSRRATIRGLHMRSELSEAKLVRVPRGEVYDVVVDLRPWSPTFLRWERFILDDARHLQVLVPPGCAHGFQALSEFADVCYRVDRPYEPAVEVCLAHDDPELAISWPLPHPILSTRDRAAPRLEQIRPLLTSWYGSAPPS